MSQRHIASHLSSTAVATEDLNYPECLTSPQSSALLHAAVSSDVRAASPVAAGSGDSGSGPAHVFPVLAASLLFLRRIEVALETPVFEKLVGEVIQLRHFVRDVFIIRPRRVYKMTRLPGPSGGVRVHRLCPSCNQCAKW